MILNIVFGLLSIPIIATIAALVGMGLFRKSGIVLSILIWSLFWGILVVWLVASQHFALVDSAINFIFYLVVSAIFLRYILKARNSVENCWLRSNNIPSYQPMVRTSNCDGNFSYTNMDNCIDISREREKIAKDLLIDLPEESIGFLHELAEKAN